MTRFIPLALRSARAHRRGALVATVRETVVETRDLVAGPLNVEEFPHKLASPERAPPGLRRVRECVAHCRRQG